MKSLITLILFVAASPAMASASLPCESQFMKEIENTNGRAWNVTLNYVHDKGATSTGEEQYSVDANFSDSACNGDAQTFEIHTQSKDSCDVVSIHADDNEDCGD